jgi:hypothetical protein
VDIKLVMKFLLVGVVIMAQCVGVYASDDDQPKSHDDQPKSYWEVFLSSKPEQISHLSICTDSTDADRFKSVSPGLTPRSFEWTPSVSLEAVAGLAVKHLVVPLNFPGGLSGVKNPPNGDIVSPEFPLEGDTIFTPKNYLLTPVDDPFTTPQNQSKQLKLGQGHFFGIEKVPDKNKVGCCIGLSCLCAKKSEIDVKKNEIEGCSCVIL